MKPLRLIDKGRHRSVFSAMACRSGVRMVRRYRPPRRSRLATGLPPLAAAILDRLASIRRSEALIIRTQASLLAYLADANRLRDLGFRSVAGFGEAIVKLRRRTVYDRLALHKILVTCPIAEEAFLAGRLTQCQLLALAPLLTGDDAADWIEKGSRLTVREIRRLVREAGAQSEGELTDARERVAFEAPAEFDVVWRETCEIARSVLGYDAPQHACLEAILQETGLSGLGDAREEVGAGDAATEDESADRFGASESHRIGRSQANRIHGSTVEMTAPARPIDSGLEIRVRENLAALALYCDEVRELVEADPPASAEEARDRLIETGLLLAPLRALTGRVICDLRKSGLYRHAGYHDLDRCVAETCLISERTAKNRIDAAFAFEDLPQLEDAYAAGEIGVVAAHLLHRLRPGRNLDALLARARAVTARQWIREYRLLRNLESCGREIASNARRPLPQPGLEEALVGALCREGSWSRERLRATMAEREMAPPIAGESDDPAENPALLDRLEFLVDLLLLVDWDEPPDPFDRLGGPSWKTSAHSSTSRRFILWLPEELAADLDAALVVGRSKTGRRLPIWAILTLLSMEARAVWLRHDPKRRPRHLSILKRDRFRCQVPFCDRRRNLEVHHIEPRSQGGSDDPGNLITLCACCHRRLIHSGSVRLRGQAPHALTWKLGGMRGANPTMRLKGNRIVR